ncbi:hypothetical protein [Candidatus Phytoplasma luffae]|nr:hypothetical protein [Candidatus Phytoplasma luffae]
MKKILRKLSPIIIKKMPTDGFVGEVILNISSDLFSEMVINY